MNVQEFICSVNTKLKKTFFLFQQLLKVFSSSLILILLFSKLKTRKPYCNFVRYTDTLYE